MYYVVKYKLFFHTFNKEIESIIKVNSGLSYFDGEINRKVYQQTDAVDFVKATHKKGDIKNYLKYLKIFMTQNMERQVLLVLPY